MKNLIGLILFLILAFSQVVTAQKVLSAYGGFTSADIKNRADIPLQANMTVSGSNVNCTNINVTQVKNVLGESVTGVGALCQSANVNKWSNYSSREWLISWPTITNSVKFPYQLGSFAGYDKEAV